MNRKHRFKRISCKWYNFHNGSCRNPDYKVISCNRCLGFKSTMYPIELRTDCVYTICGQRGSGKSTLAKHFVYKLDNNRIPYLILDPTGEYYEFKNRIVPAPGVDRQELFLKLGQRIWEGADETGGMVIIIDEAETFLNQGDRYLPKWWDSIVWTGRHKGIGLIAITRRTANLHKDVISSSDKIFMFYHFEKNDVNYLREFVGDDAYKLRNYQEFEFMVREKRGIITEFKPLNIR